MPQPSTTALLPGKAESPVLSWVGWACALANLLGWLRWVFGGSMHLARPPSIKNKLARQPSIHPNAPPSVFGRQDARPHWSAWWLPCAGVGMLLLAYFLDAEVRRMERDIGGLEKLKYNYKTI